MILSYFALSANLIATVYGYGELRCGDVGNPVACDSTAITASGEKFNPNHLSAAIPMPKNLIMRPFDIYLKTFDGKCVKVRVNDKKNPRYIGNGGLDLSRATVKAITGKDDQYWSGGIQLCQPK